LLENGVRESTPNLYDTAANNVNARTAQIMINATMMSPRPVSRTTVVVSCGLSDPPSVRQMVDFPIGALGQGRLARFLILIPALNIT